MVVEIARYSLIIFGTLVLLGGAIGWKRAGSKASLMSAVIAESLLIMAFVMTFFDMKIGLLAGDVIALMLLIVFIIRLAKTRSFMPSGLMLLLSIGETALLTSAYIALG